MCRNIRIRPLILYTKYFKPLNLCLRVMIPSQYFIVIHMIVQSEHIVLSLNLRNQFKIISDIMYTQMLIFPQRCNCISIRRERNMQNWRQMTLQRLRPRKIAQICNLNFPIISGTCQIFIIR